MEKEKVLEHFRELTMEDRENAERFLEKCKWQLDEAVNKYFTGSSQDSNDGTADNPIEILDTPNKPSSVPKVLSTTDKTRNRLFSSDSNLKLLSWNIDGLHEEQMKERLRYIINLIRTRLPDVVFLQEVIQGMLEFFRLKLPEYQVLPCTEPNTGYYNAMLLNASTTKATDECQLEFFQTSQMGRHYLKQSAIFHDKVKLVLMTSHLESMKECAEERKRQLAEMFKVMASENPDAFVIFGGDLNVRDKEVDAVGVPWRMADMWEACGSDPFTQYTWDTSVNDNLGMPWKSKLRFDRIFYRNDTHVSLHPRCFTLVGKDRLASGMFPSDHWGLWCEFKEASSQRSSHK